MRRSFWCFIILVTGLPFSTVLAQEQPDNRYMFRVYEDNDVINIYDIGSDRGYTNGTRLDLFWREQKRSFMNKLMPQAGKNSINIHSWSLMQVIITPDNILRRKPDPADYPYSGALFVSRSLHSSNPVTKLSLQTEWVVGVMGPPSLAQETQKLIHRVIGAQPPRGWAYQQPADFLLNYHFTVNKQLARYRQWAELIGSGQVYAGTMLNGAALYTTIRIGNMNPYFEGYMQQFTAGKKRTNKWQLYFTIQPAVELILHNALLEGGVFNHGIKQQGSEPGTQTQYVRLAEQQRLIGRIDLGAVVSKGNIGLSFTQKSSTALIKGLPRQDVGNISLYIGW